MRKIFITLFALFSFNLFSQTSNMNFYTENGEKFTMFINGIQQNQQPLSNIRIISMPSSNYRVKVKFEIDSMGVISDMVTLASGVEKTWRIKQRNPLNISKGLKKNVAPVNTSKEKYVIRIVSENQLSSNNTPPPLNMNTSQQITYNANGYSGSNSTQSTSINVGTNGMNTNTNVNQNQNMSSTVNIPNYGKTNCSNPLNQIQFNAEKSKIIMQKTASGKNILAKKCIQNKCLTSQQIFTLVSLLPYSKDRLELSKIAYTRCFDPDNYEVVFNAFNSSYDVDELENYIETVNASNTNSNVNTNVNQNQNNNQNNTSNNGTNANVNIGWGQNGVNVNVNTNGQNQNTNVNQNQNNNQNNNYNNGNNNNNNLNYNGPTGCPMPMSFTDFESAKNSIDSKDFESTKLDVAKQITNVNCLTTEQIKVICKSFGFESTRLEFAKYAYTHTYDKNNYYKVNDAFEFESSITELQNYIKGK